MRRGGVLLVRRSVPDVSVQNDERGTPLRLPESFKSVFYALEVVGGADPQHVPIISQEAGHDVFRERDARAPLDRDVVVVVYPAEIVETQMTGQRSRFRPHAFHQTTVAANDINVVIKDLESGSVVAAGEPLLSDGHADARGDTLSQRTCGCLHARCPMVFGVSGRFAVELAEAAYVVERNRGPPQRFIFGVHCPRAAEM